MELFCPHCTRRVAVPEDKAGQVMSCPLCAKPFQAPALAPPPSAPKPPAPPSVPNNEESYGVGPAQPKPPVSSLPPIPEPRKPEPETEAPPVPPGEYSRSCACSLRANWLAFVPPACLLVILVLSFFSWHMEVRTFPVGNKDSETLPTLNLWQLAFTEKGNSAGLAYVLFLIPAIALSIAALLFEKRIFHTPPQLALVVTFKDLAVTLVLLAGFAALCFASIDAHLLQRSNPLALAFKIAFRLHFVALLASLGMFWLNWRKRGNLPAPKIEAHW